MVKVKLRDGITLQSFREFIQGKERKQALRELRAVLFLDRFDRPPWYKTPGVVGLFEGLIIPLPPDIYNGQRDILFFAYYEEYKTILKKLFRNI
jgi:hypothetical protein